MLRPPQFLAEDSPGNWNTHKNESQKRQKNQWDVLPISLFYFTKQGEVVTNEARGPLLDKSACPYYTSGLGLRLRGEKETVHRQESPCRKPVVCPGYQADQQMLSSPERGWVCGGPDVPWPISRNKRPLSWTVSNNSVSHAFSSHVIHLLRELVPAWSYPFSQVRKPRPWDIK